ncbi:MAG: Xanthine dehydrogenase iron-sulfur subunit (EC / Xanthine dehydrogenase, FAD binding subunit (EC [uncultured Paraburkholderia sp.]|nr:MAG: Xanthine dehydrogenase iron-sulfur subunit (EC / Xanthine dehydrogenase, FAD binding subunit (EC [uncultured Paraburkholderia sp.]
MAIYVREAGFGATPCVTRARSALSSGFAMTTQTIRFYRQGSVHEVAGVPASRTLLQHLREDLHCTGPRKAALKATAAPARWWSANSTRTARWR